MLGQPDCLLACVPSAALLAGPPPHPSPLCLVQEVAAARTIAQRGVLLVGTAHGNSLRDLMANPELRPLVGGVQAVTLGDAAAQQTNKGNKVRGNLLEMTHVQ